ncbi:MAG: flagellar motor protein MotB [Geminicoccaceae bacterium]
MMRAARRSSIGANAWLATFTDLAALILAFFVLSFSMLVLREDDRRSIQKQYETPLQFDTGAQLPSNLDHVADPSDVQLHPSDIYLSTILGDRLEGLGLASSIRIEPRPRGMDLFLEGLAQADGTGWALEPVAASAIERVLSSARSTGRHVAILAPRGSEDDLARAFARAEAVLDAARLSGRPDIIVTEAPNVRSSATIGFRLERE